MAFRHWIFALLIIAMCGCSSHMESVMDMAGSNRVELEKAWNHFRESDDPLIKEAGQFLLENMPVHKGPDKAFAARYDSMFLKISEAPQECRDSLYKERGVKTGNARHVDYNIHHQSCSI